MASSSMGVWLRRGVSLIVWVGLTACDGARLTTIDAGIVGSMPQDRRIEIRNIGSVDLLFVIDNSNSMAEEQARLIQELPRLISDLATGDHDRDGLRELLPVESLHVGIVTSDMGAGPSTRVPTCRQGLGDDGILRSMSRATSAGCSADHPSGVFGFARSVDDTAAFATTLGCVADVGTAGCGFEQQLEAPLKALTPPSATTWTRPGYTPPSFVSADGIPDSIGGNGAAPSNAGFLRPDSVLAVVLLTDEEDCSVLDYGVFDRDDTRFTSVPLNRRCHAFGAAALGVVHPVSRYVSGFSGLRGDPSLLVFAGIIGIPPAAESAAASGDYAAVLANPSMIPTVDATGNNLLPSCTTADGSAYPPVRIVETAAGLAAGGAYVSLSSICASSFRPAVAQLASTVAGALRISCLPSPLGSHADGRVNCEVHELLPAAGVGVASRCVDLPGRVFLRTVIDDLGRSRELCSMTQLDRDTAIADTVPGWYYDDFQLRLLESCPETPQRIAVTTSTPSVPGSELRLLCP